MFNYNCMNKAKRLTPILVLLLIICGCKNNNTTTQASDQPSQADTTKTTTTNTILFFGNSLTAGYGLDDPAQAFPALIQEKIDSMHLAYKVVNAGVSGETSAGGNGRIAWILKQPVDV